MDGPRKGTHARILLGIGLRKVRGRTYSELTSVYISARRVQRIVHVDRHIIIRTIFRRMERAHSYISSNIIIAFTGQTFRIK